MFVRSFSNIASDLFQITEEYYPWERGQVSEIVVVAVVVATSLLANAVSNIPDNRWLWSYHETSITNISQSSVKVARQQRDCGQPSVKLRSGQH